MADARRGPAGFRLPKECLIRDTAEYSQCYALGKRVHTRHFLLFVAPQAEGLSGVRFGTAVSRRTGCAAVRNRLKRVLKECFRLRIRSLPVSARIVAVAKRRAGEDLPGLAETSAELLQALDSFFRLSEGTAR